MADDPETPEPGLGPGQKPASPRWIIFLTLYLVVLTAGLLWGVYREWPSCVVVCVAEIPTGATSTPTPTGSTQPTQTPTPTPQGTGTTTPPRATPTAAPTPPPTQTQSPTPVPTPTIESVSPKSGLIKCNIQVTIKGKNFKDGATVSFGGVPATGKVDPSGQFINVQPPAHVEGDVDLVVKNSDGTTSDIAKAAYTYTCPPTSETELFLLVIFAGALGGTLHGLRSLYWYVGLRSLLKSWTLMYILLPFTGAVIAVIFYAVIRAGLLPVPSTKEASLVIVAISVLVGLFSQQAAVKLKDVAEAFLAKPAVGPAAESKPQGSVPPGTKPDSNAGQGGPKSTDPAQGKAGDKVQIKGTRMQTVTSIMFGTVELGRAEYDLKDGTLTITVPERPATQTDPKVNVVVKGDTPTPLTVTFSYQS